MLYTPLLKLFFLRLQDPEGEPLMLDRFDARWMLDMGDFSKGPMSRVSAKLIAEVGGACAFGFDLVFDTLRRGD